MLRLRRCAHRLVVSAGRPSSFGAAHRCMASAAPESPKSRDDGFWSKCAGVPEAKSPPPPSYDEIALSGALSACGIGSLSLLHFQICSGSDLTMILGSFGASAVLLYAAPQVPLSQPRNVLGGHLIACTVGVACHELVSVPMGTPAVSCAIAVSSSIMLMQCTRTLHPPAGGTALIAVMGSESLHALGFQLLVPTTLGASTLVLVALANNISKSRQYPQYWW